MASVTTQLLRHTDKINEAEYAKFVAKTQRGYERWVRLAKTGNDRERRRFRDYAEWTPEQIAEATRFYCESYRHQFRIMEVVASA